MKNVHHVFWTGGLDSTFRLIFLLNSFKEPVQAHYIVRHEASTGNEIDAINKIRRAVTLRYPEWKANLLPTKYTNEELIPRSAKLALEIKKVEEKVHVHEQLHILADYCQASDIEHIDISYERDENVEPGSLRVAQFFQVSPAFKSFHNAHEHLTKKDCYNMAVTEGWDDLLRMTSFCRRPRIKGKSCGICGPCCDAVKEGMGFRLPFIPRMKARMLIPFRQFYRKNYNKHDSNWFFLMIKRKLECRL